MRALGNLRGERSAGGCTGGGPVRQGPAGHFGRFLTHCILPPGSRLSKVYSQSTLSLSTVANEAPNHLGVKRPTSR